MSAFAAVLLAIGLTAQTEVPPAGETLVYSVNWPSGLSLGEAQLSSVWVPAGTGRPGHWEFRLSLDAAIPGVSVADRFRSEASGEFCSIEFEKQTSHGSRKGKEHITFDQHAGSATRQTVGGGNSRLEIPPCGKDALAFLQFLRRELAEGRLPPAQTILFGGPYQVRLEYGGRQQVTIADRQVEADRITATLKGQASEISVEVFFARDKARRLLLVRAPLSLGTFSMELVP